MKRCIFIIGIHRSGSSMLAGIIKLLGAYFGLETDLRKPGNKNPKGFFENMKVLKPTSKLMSSFNRDYYSLEIENHLFRGPITDKYKDDIKTLLDEYFFIPGVELVCIKDLKISRLLPLWLEILEEGGIKPIFMVIFRNPNSVATSYKKSKLDKFLNRIWYIMNLWFNYYRDILNNVPGHDVMFVHYDGLLEDVHGTVKKIANFINLEDKYNDVAIISKIDDFVSAGLNINKSTYELTDKTVELMYNKLIERAK